MAGVSKSTERLVNVIVCVGAAIVIFGAWQKITHQPLADFFLTAGLITEAVIFVVYAFLPPPGSEMHAIAEALPKLAGGSSNSGKADVTESRYRRPCGDGCAYRDRAGGLRSQRSAACCGSLARARQGNKAEGWPNP